MREEPLTLSRQRITELLERVCSIYEQALSDSPEARSRLGELGIRDQRLLDIHRVGLSDGRLCEILPRGGPAPDDLRRLGILDSKGREYLAGKVIFPILDPEGGIVNLYGMDVRTGSRKME